MKESKYYTCEYCFNEFEPKRRRVQKFCSATCRSKAHHAKNNKNAITDNATAISNTPTSKSEKMSVAGIGNAAAGTLAADAIKSLLTQNSNKPATKGDLSELLEKLKSRYHLIKNIAPNHLGQYAYYDIVDGVWGFY